GEHSFNVVVVDEAGNESAPTTPIDFTVVTEVATITIDSVVDDKEAVIGDIANNGVTNDDTPTLNGTANPNATVHIYDNGTEIGTVISGSDGSWSFTADSLADGEHDFTATVELPNSGESAPTDAWVINVDTLAPDPIDDITSPDNLTVYDDVPEITGNVDNGGLTNDNHPDFSGKDQVPGDTITIIDNGVELGKAVVKDDGTWSFTPTDAMADGEHAITLVVSDEAGNSSAPSDPFNFTIDSLKPDPADNIVIIDDQGDKTGTVVPDGATDDTTPTIDGDAEPGSKVIIIDNGEEIATVDVDENGEWSYTPDEPLDGGEHEIEVVVVDEAGNESDPSDPIVFSIVTEGSVDFEDEEITELKEGEAVTLDSGMTITSLDSGRDAGTYVNEITDTGIFLFGPKTFGTQAMQLLAESETKIEFGGETNAVSFDVSAVSGTDSVVHYWDAEGNELYSQPIPSAPDNNVATVSWTAPEGEYISYITIDVGQEQGNSLIRVDNFTWGDTQVESGVEASQPAVQSTADDHHDLATLDTHEAGGQLAVSADDVLNGAQENLLIDDGKSQFSITGENGEQVELQGVTESSLEQHGSVTSGGVSYDIYTVAGNDTELLVQHGLELHTTA
ncbi:MAG: Ig-like domain-containing protein, partial [Scandinavium sp.]|uniref:Ig-like domain-containing protein n=1 Tax=Scandinavium sp. TaxID=2830653 RepID=UPI003F2DBF9A